MPSKDSRAIRIHNYTYSRMQEVAANLELPEGKFSHTPNDIIMYLLDCEQELNSETTTITF